MPDAALEVFWFAQDTVELYVTPAIRTFITLGVMKNSPVLRASPTTVEHPETEHRPATGCLREECLIAGRQLLESRDPRFEYDRVRASELAALPPEVPPSNGADPASVSKDLSYVTVIEGDITHRLWRVSSLRKPQPRGDFYMPEWTRRSTASMTLAQREAYLNNNYYQAAGDSAPPFDPRYQFSLLLGARDGGFRTVSRIDMKVTATEVRLLQHLSLRFDADVRAML